MEEEKHKPSVVNPHTIGRSTEPEPFAYSQETANQVPAVALEPAKEIIAQKEKEQEPAAFGFGW